MSFQQPAGFRPLLRDDSLPHQIRILDGRGSFGTQVPSYGCVCGVHGGCGLSVEALAWYRTHLAETAQTSEECRRMTRDVKEVTQ